MDQLDPLVYTVAWIAPLEIEAICALHMLDNKHRGRFTVSHGDDYVFQAGDMCGHNIVIATLPAGQEYGTGSAAALAAQVKKFFPNLWFGLLVSVAARLPSLSGTKQRDIRLSDVLVALPEGDSAGLVAYDLGKETGKDGFQPLQFGHVLAVTKTIIRSAIRSIKMHAPKDTDFFLPFYNDIKQREHANGTFIDPGQDNDVFYDIDKHGVQILVARERRLDSKRTRVWYRPIGSREKLVKKALKRNELREKYNVIGLEMEAARTMNRIPVGVIRGVCDYGDEHKNKEWQPYAAAMAAAYAKAVLAQIGARTSKLPAKDQTQQVKYTQTLKGHRNSVYSVTFSHDSELVASASADNTVCIWRVDTGECTQTLNGHKDRVISVAFSHDSRLIASASHDGTVRIWRIETGECTRTLKGYSDFVNSVAFSHDSQLVASASADKTVRIWRVDTGECTQTLNGHRNAVYSVTFSHDSELVASASADETVRICCVDTGECKQTLKGHSNSVTSVAFSHDSRLIASASHDKTVRIWRVDTGECTQTLNGHKDKVTSVAFSHDSRLIASASGDKTVRIWRANTGESARRPKG